MSPFGIQANISRSAGSAAIGAVVVVVVDVVVVVELVVVGAAVVDAISGAAVDVGAAEVVVSVLPVAGEQAANSNKKGKSLRTGGIVWPKTKLRITPGCAAIRKKL